VREQEGRGEGGGRKHVEGGNDGNSRIENSFDISGIKLKVYQHKSGV